MAGVTKTNIQLGDNSNPANNFSLTAAAANGTMKLARGNDNATTQDILTVDATGNVNIPVGLKIGGVAGQKMMLTATQATTAGTFVDFLNIPSWAKKITVQFYNFGTSAGAGYPIIQIGTSSGIQTTGYGSTGGLTATASVAAALITTAFNVGSSSGNWLNTTRGNGSVILTLVDQSTGIWACNGIIANSQTVGVYYVAGSKQLSGTLDRVRVATADGVSTLTNGSVSLLIEGY